MFKTYLQSTRENQRKSLVSKAGGTFLVQASVFISDFFKNGSHLMNCEALFHILIYR